MPAGAPRPFENTVNTFGQNQTEQSYGLGNSNQNQNLSWPQSYGLGSENQTFEQENNNSPQWGLNNTPLAQNNNNTLLGNSFGNNNLFNQNQSVWNKNQYQTPTPWAKQSTSLGRNQPVQNKPVYENPNPQGYSAGNIAWSALEGFGEGIENGSLRLANAATFNRLENWCDNIFDNAYTKQEQSFQAPIKNQGLSVPLKIANAAVDLGSQAKIWKKIGNNYIVAPTMKYVGNPMINYLKKFK